MFQEQEIQNIVDQLIEDLLESTDLSLLESEEPKEHVKLLRYIGN